MLKEIYKDGSSFAKQKSCPRAINSRAHNRRRKGTFDFTKVVRKPKLEARNITSNLNYTYNFENIFTV